MLHHGWESAAGLLIGFARLSVCSSRPVQGYDKHLAKFAPCLYKVVGAFMQCNKVSCRAAVDK